MGRVSPADYFHVGNTLAEAKYFFTLLNSGNFFHALKNSNWSVNSTVSALIELLARPANEPQGVLNLKASENGSKERFIRFNVWFDRPPQFSNIA
jgi:hypothetical protein